MLRPIAVALIACLPAIAAAGENPTVSLAELVSKAIRSSRLNQAGTPPFHLKAVIKDPAAKDSDQTAQIEEDWIAPDKWRRSIKTPDFSQTLIVNGDKVSEVIQGDYYPFWLRYAVTAIFDLVPQDFTPRDMEVRAPSTGIAGVDRTLEHLSLRGSGSTVGTCNRWDDRVGDPPAQNSVLSTVCFVIPTRLSAVSTPYFNAQYEAYESFKQMDIPRLIKIYIEPGVILEAKVTQLNELRHPDEAWFVLDSTPQKDLTYSMRIRETDARAFLLDSPDIAWAPVTGGTTKGALSIVVYIDRDGKVRETRPLNSDNPDPQDQARRVVAHWHFKPQLRNGAPVQIEALLTFAFDTTAAEGAPLLSNEQARKLAYNTPEATMSNPKFPKGTEYAVRIDVNERGAIMNIENINHLDPQLFTAGQTALSLWFFHPYKQDGKPHRFSADIVFHVK